MKRRSNCPLSCTLELIGDKWTLLIIRDIVKSGKKNFKDFMGSSEGISTKTLSKRLQLLVEENILEKTISPHNKLVFDYTLTPKGRDLVPVMLEIGKWGSKYFDETLPFP